MAKPDYTLKNLREVEDSGAKHGLSEMQEARFPREDLDAESTGIALLTVKPGQRQPFAHHHKQAEEVYVVLSGSGRIKLDEELVELKEMDAIRMGPTVTRMLEAGDDGLEVLAFGTRQQGDAEMVQGFWD